MKRLICVDTREAVYYEDGEDRPEIDPVAYLADFLGIRSAGALVEFLRDYPEGLVAAEPWGGYEREALLPGLDDWFSEKNIRGAVKKINRVTPLEYLEEPSRSIEEHRYPNGSFIIDENGNIGPGLCAVSICDLHIVREHLERVFRTAAAALGKCEADFCEVGIDEQTGFQYVRIPCQYVWDMRPVFSGYVYGRWDVRPPDEEWETTFSNHKYLENMRSFLFDDINPPEVFVDGEHVVYRRTDDEILLPEDVAGYLAAWAVNKWDRLYSNEQRPELTYGHRTKFFIQRFRQNIFTQAMQEILATERLGICDHCGRPFIIRRLGKDGEARRKYCSRSCMTIASRERSQGAENG